MHGQQNIKICAKMFHSQYYLVAAVVHIQYPSSQMCVCVYTHIFFTI